MIRINLLPFRLARRKENIRRQVSIFLLSVILVSFAMVWYILEVDRKIKITNSRIASVNNQIASYKEKADRVTQIKKKLKVLTEKLDIVASLATRKDEQQILLEELADQMVPERMWLEKLTVNAAQVSLRGIAFDNPTIADFMRNLETSALFASVDLKRSKTKSFDDVYLKEFELVCEKKKPSNKPDASEEKN
ncbi:MAG TPA: pilus assembly protein PilN [Desulfobacteraceae bacterium]|nr:pilus assembly protein PilN [Desulfobacteraceae bacterium]